MDKYTGNDNYGKPKSEYVTKVAEMTDHDLALECDKMIWLSAYAGNNPRSDYHWQCDVCYHECERRGKPEIYSNAHEALVADA